MIFHLLISKKNWLLFFLPVFCASKYSYSKGFDLHHFSSSSPHFSSLSSLFFFSHLLKDINLFVSIVVWDIKMQPVKSEIWNTKILFTPIHCTVSQFLAHSALFPDDEWIMSGLPGDEGVPRRAPRHTQGGSMQLAS